MRFKGEWKDLGTWNTFTESMDDVSIGNAILDDTCSNVHIINELGVPVLAMGLKNVVVSASTEGILVSDKERSSSIKQYVDSINNQIMFSEKSWGEYRVLDVEEESMTIKTILKPYQKMSYHSHEKRDEVWTIISGSGKTIVDGMEQPVSVGDVLTIQAGCKHTIIAGKDGLQVIEVQLGKGISVKDKTKYDFPEN